MGEWGNAAHKKLWRWSPVQGGLATGEGRKKKTKKKEEVISDRGYRTQLSGK